MSLWERPGWLDPEGAARVLTPGLPAGVSGASADTRADARGFDADLRAHLAACDVAPSSIQLAWEVSRWLGGLPPAETRAAALLVVLVQEALDAGSSTLPLPADDDDLGWSELMRPLELAADEAASVRRLARALGSGELPPALRALFGPPDARSPFIYDHGCLTQERLWSLEERIAAELGPRLADLAARSGVSDLFTDDAQPGAAPPAPTRPGPARRTGTRATKTDARQMSFDALAGARPAAPPPAESTAMATATATARRPTAEQAAAVQDIVARRFVLVTGGPGAGKTTVIVSALDELVRAGTSPADVALAAPTGRAAQRIDEAVRAVFGDRFPRATTIHRLLGEQRPRAGGLFGGDTTYHAGWRLPQRVVIVDEASMLDLDLFDRLLSAVADDARLVLLGDPDQLPSVRAGAAFRDLVAAAPEVVARLTQSHRATRQDPDGARLLDVAAAIRDGIAPTREHGVVEGTEVAGLRLRGVELLPTRALGGLLRRWYCEPQGPEGVVTRCLDRIVRGATGATGATEDAALLGDALDHLAAARVLCLTRDAARTTSVAAVNATFHRMAQETALAHSAGTALADGPFVPGEPVIVLRNDYTRGLTNGQPGLVVRFAPAGAAGAPGPGALGVAFAAADGVTIFPLDELAQNVELAFALTVHKAQGSEFDRVAIVLPERDSRLLSRELVYTALTRARHGAVIVGDPALLAIAAARGNERSSDLARRLFARVPF